MAKNKLPASKDWDICPSLPSKSAKRQYQHISASSLSETGRRCEKSAERGQILRDLQRQYRDIDQKAREIWPAQVILQPTILVSDRLLDYL